jgi:hypothetical protein
MNNLAIRKFAKGFLSGSAVSLVAVLQANGCNITDLKVFGLTVLSGTLSGIFHTLVAIYFNANSSTTESNP